MYTKIVLTCLPSYKISCGRLKFKTRLPWAAAASVEKARLAEVEMTLESMVEDIGDLMEEGGSKMKETRC